MSVTRLVKKQTKDETFEIFDTVGKINKIDSFFEIKDMFDDKISNIEHLVHEFTKAN